MKPIFIYGAPASGKSTLGKRLAESLGAKFVDLDAAIVEREGKSIPDIFASQGEAAFRDIESEVLREVSGVNNLLPITYYPLTFYGRTFQCTAIYWVVYIMFSKIESTNL